VSTKDLSMDRVTTGVTIKSPTLTPEQISERVGISWDEVQRVGDPRGHLGKKWDRNVWRIFEKRQGTPTTGAHELLPECIDAILHRLKPVSDKLRASGLAEGAEFFIHVSAQSVPGIHFSPDALRTLADAGVSLDVDIILYSLAEN